ncbi:MurR/RpiR family transcriptional regulator [Bombilactobacillus thymidiniphilus]|uniref:MurR/RpiR family transcriptional regulator n=1 Tax=Bombilactobacillus thymidiniphilus TaxID=2923363 RepID=A0ABY4PEH0_9LACO|nr:MurR/RpiR family transcriptional regulator [Bombilactobacillus thymidiniphilus]UQS84184.1 MurR/RpiR family transcriptional regulator [Bombilactobacillus thymidiniphilus]
MVQQKLTPTQNVIYQYIMDHKSVVKDYSLRQLAAKLKVAPASVVRTVKKLGYRHYYELCAQLDQEVQGQVRVDDITYQASTFFRQQFKQQYEQSIKQFQKMILPTTNFIFFGVGTSGDLAGYGARQFVNNGQIAFAMNDPFNPTQLGRNSYRNYVVMILSVSGETEQTIDQAVNFQDQGAQVVSITNTSSNTLAGLSDINFSYSITPRIIGNSINLTSQLPVVYLLERLAQATHTHSVNSLGTGVKRTQ